jgi:demethylmenaquinone methyltransferase/2-methoxy-6-polyprenyl-1,4-benzoquinol methylase
MSEPGTMKRLIGGIYSVMAKSLYEPIVVRGTLPLLGGDLHTVIAAQGRRAVATAAGRPILDLPVGTAFFTIETAGRHPGVVVGADIARGMVYEAAERAKVAGIANLATVQADAHDLPFEDGSFGAILCTNGLQVIPGLTQTLSEMARVLAKDGVLYVCVVHVPIGALLPQPAAARLPTLLTARSSLTGAFTGAGLRVTSAAA